MEIKICTHKTCSHQGKPQPIDNFNRSFRHKDGRHSWCKDCCAEYQRAYKQSDAGKAKLRKYFQSVKIRAKVRSYQISERGKAAKRRARQSEKGKAAAHRRYERLKSSPIYLQKRIAQLKVNLAVVKGELPPVKGLTCIHCGQPAREYHHYLGYAEEHWFDVIPLCIPCHRRVDRESPPVANL